MYNQDESVSETGGKKYFWEKMIGFSLLGGLVSALMYYIYENLSDAQKREIKESIMEKSKPALARFIAEKLES